MFSSKRDTRVDENRSPEPTAAAAGQDSNPDNPFLRGRRPPVQFDTEGWMPLVKRNA